MADINQLSAVDTLNAGDLLPIWKTNNGDTRKAAMSVLQSYMQNNLTFPTVTGVSQFVPQYASPVATGFTVTLTSNSDNRWLILTPLAGYAAGTIVFPALANVVDNQEILIVSTQAVAALTINGNGATVVGAPAYVSANGGFRFKFNALGGIWYRLDEDLDPDLAALAGVSSSGLLARTGAGTAAARTVTGSTGLTVTNGDGVSGNPTLTLDATLAGISAVTTASDQLVYSTGVDTFATTSFTAAGRLIVGYAALQSNTTGSNNIALGTNALASNTTASSNVSAGVAALRYFNTSSNTAFGHEAAQGSTTVANNTGDNLTAIGSNSLSSNTSGASNTAVGHVSLTNNTTGASNTAVGVSSLQSNTTGTFNSAFGSQSLFSNTTGSSNAAFGRDALLNFNTSNNVAIGLEAAKGSNTVANNTGSALVAIGYKALVANTSGANNIAIGYQAGDAITTGSTNIVIGHDIDVDSATGSNQINIGDRFFHDRIRLLERTSDPAKPAEGNMIVWMSDGTGLGDDGDIIIASTAGGVTNYAILFDHSAGTIWP